MVNEAKQDIMEELEFNKSKRDKCKFSLDNKKIDTMPEYLKKMMPLDKKVILELGCGVEYYGKKAKSFPWMDVIVIADGLEIISPKGETFSKTKFSLLRGDIASLPFSDKSFDCVCINNTLERISEVDKVLCEIYRILNWRGTLLATIRSDARNPKKICDCHVWKTAPHEVKMRLDHASFVNIEIKEIDTFRTFGLPPYPPSRDQMIFVKAWKRKKEASREERAIEMMDWVYRNLSPDKSQESNDPVEILSGGYAFCWGYAVVLGKLLEREGFEVNWVTMLARGHPKGRGKDKVDSHEVVTVQIDGTEKILDPMANTVIPYPLADVLSQPELAEEKKEQDSRYKERGYCLYDTSYWYSRVFRYAIRSKTDDWFVRWRKNRAKV
jgi:ubiquinone/menaquinone biosynthesis C-methylase UbiE